MPWNVKKEDTVDAFGKSTASMGQAVCVRTGLGRASRSSVRIGDQKDRSAIGRQPIQQDLDNPSVPLQHHQRVR